MLRPVVHAVLRRELGAVRRTVEAYPDDASVWACPPGLPNAGGTLVLHLAGNLRHYLGAVLGGTGYVRDRPAEFARRGVGRAELLAEVDAARDAVDRAFAALEARGGGDGALAAPLPEPVGGREVAVGDFLVHAATHLAYHLGQLDYHRRAVTGDPASVGAVSPAELPARAPAAAPPA